MASVRNPDGLRLRGFPTGVNNVAPEQDPPTDEFGRATSLREAVNVDLVGPGKKVRRRQGYALQISGRAHSPATIRGSGLLYAVVDGDLNVYDRSFGLLDTVRAGVGDGYLTYAEVNGELYWSNRTEFRCIRGGVDTPGWIDCPGVPAATAMDASTSALDPGTYRVAMTWFDADGRESGAAGIAEVDIAAGQLLRVVPPAAPVGAAKGRIYVSPPNGEELYATQDITIEAWVGIGRVGDGKLLETLWRAPLPPSEILRFGHGRLFFASGNLLGWSDALRFGLTTHDNYFRLGQEITMLEPLGDGDAGAGVFAADHKNVYWFDGANPKEWRRRIVYGHAAVPGTSLVVPGNVLGLDTTAPVAAWMGKNGVFCAGLPGGAVQPLTEGKLALPDGERGAALYREQQGIRQLVMSYLTTDVNRLAIGDRASASVTRYS